MRANQQSSRTVGLLQLAYILAFAAMLLVLSHVPCLAQCAGNAASTVVTSADETGSIAGSRQLVNGSGTTINLLVPGRIAVDVAAAVPTYIGSNPQYVVPATPRDMITIYGSATKTVKILKLRLLTEQTTAGTNFIYLYRRSSAESGATPQPVTAVKCDTNDASATATMSWYLANPTDLGTTDPKIIDGWDVQAPAAASNIQPNWQEIFNANYAGKPIILRGTSQGIALNFGGAALPSGFKVQLQAIWTEE